MADWLIALNYWFINEENAVESESRTTTYQLPIERLTPRAWAAGKPEDRLTVKMADWMTKELTELQTTCLTDRETDETPGWVNYRCVKHDMIDRLSGRMTDFSSFLPVRRIFFLLPFVIFLKLLPCPFLFLPFADLSPSRLNALGPLGLCWKSQQRMTARMME